MKSVRKTCVACFAGLTAVGGIAATSDVSPVNAAPGAPGYAGGAQPADPMQAGPKATVPVTPVTDKLSDNQITMKVRSELRATEGIDTSGIKVSTTNGVVHLSGSVKSDKDRLTALNATRSVAGIITVEDEMKVAK